VFFQLDAPFVGAVADKFARFTNFTSLIVLAKTVQVIKFQHFSTFSPFVATKKGEPDSPVPLGS
jgi:hypothetical protein